MDEHGKCCYCYTRSSEFRIGLICLECHKGVSRLRDLMADDDPPRDKISIFKRVEGALNDRRKLRDRVTSLSELVSIFRYETSPDILVKSGRDDGPVIPAHRAVLAAKSPVLKNMVMESSSDPCKAPATPSEILTFFEMNHEELKVLLDFLYKGGTEFEDKVKFLKHATSLLVASHKYDISPLKEFCERKMVAALDAGNVIEFLEGSELSGNRKLKDVAVEFIRRNKHVVFRSEFNAFALKNPLLSLEVTRSCISEQLGFS